jgi:hypothetical protein
MPELRLAGKTYNPGNTLGAAEFKDMLKSGYTAESIIRRAKEAGISISDGARQVARQSSAGTSAPAPDPTVTTPDFSYNILPDGNLDISPGMTRDMAAEYQFQSGLLTLAKNADQELEKLRGLSAAKVAEIGAGATVRSAELSKEASDFAELTRKAAGESIETIRGQNNLNLQGVINEGTKAVEQLRKETAENVANISGEFGVKQEATRQKGQKDIANIGSASSLRNALVSAFSF